MHERLRRLRAVAAIGVISLFISLLGRILGYLFDAAAQGLIGEGASALFPFIWGMIVNNWNMVVVSLILLFSAIFSLLLLLYYFLHYRKVGLLKGEHATQKLALETKIQMLSALLSLDDTLIRLLSGIPLDPDPEKAMQRLMEVLLVNAIMVLSDKEVFGASLYLPDQGRQILRIWVSRGVTHESLANAECYIGPARANTIRGVAGDAYDSRKIIVAHQTGEKDQNGSWKFDHPGFIDFINGQMPPFSAIVCVPLIDQSAPAPARGVVCFDSKQKDTFDSPEMQELLLLIGRRFTSALLVYQEITHRQLIP